MRKKIVIAVYYEGDVERFPSGTELKTQLEQDFVEAFGDEVEDDIEIKLISEEDVEE